MEDGLEDEAIETVLKNKNVLKWRDPKDFNGTLAQWAAYKNCNKFLSALCTNKKVYPFL